MAVFSNLSNGLRNSIAKGNLVYASDGRCLDYFHLKPNVDLGKKEISKMLVDIAAWDKTLERLETDARNNLKELSLLR